MVSVSVSMLVNLEKLIVVLAAYSASVRLYGIATSIWRVIGLAEISFETVFLYVLNNGRSQLLLSTAVDSENWFSAKFTY